MFSSVYFGAKSGSPSFGMAIRRRVAEVFEGVFVLTGIFIKGVIKYECRRGEPLGGFGGMPILKSRGPEMLFSASCTSIFLTRWSVK